MKHNGLGVADIGINMCAFLDTIAFSEGTYDNPEDGYKTVVGEGQFEDYSKHPHIAVYIKRINDYSTAAGRYQILWRYANIYTKILKLPDFSPESQDKIAVQMIKEQRAFNDVNSGNIKAAIEKCCNIWASFPGAGYKQKEQKMSELLDYYAKARASYETAN